MRFDTIPEEIKLLPKSFAMTKCFIEKGHVKKVPMSIYPKTKVSVTNPDTLYNWNDCVKRLCKDDYFDGICFAVSNNICCIDLDDCFDKIGNLSPFADNIVRNFTDTYIERSMSGNGLHIIFLCDVPINNIKTKQAEIYTNKHFITLTGDSINGVNVLKDKTRECKILYDYLISKRIKSIPHNEPKKVFFPVALSDDEVIEKAMRSKSGNKFEALYNGDWQSLNIGDNSQSAADISLCNSLAFWTGCNKSQMQRIFRSSGLYRNERKMDMAIDKAIAFNYRVYEGREV